MKNRAPGVKPLSLSFCLYHHTTLDSIDNDSHQLSHPLCQPQWCLLFSYQTQFSWDCDSFVMIKHVLCSQTQLNTQGQSLHEALLCYCCCKTPARRKNVTKPNQRKKTYIIQVFRIFPKPKTTHEISKF